MEIVEEPKTASTPCPDCGCCVAIRTHRTDTHIEGEFNGLPFDQVVRLWLKCVQCERVRIDAHRFNRGFRVFTGQPTDDESLETIAATPPEVAAAIAETMLEEANPAAAAFAEADVVVDETFADAVAEAAGRPTLADQVEKPRPPKRDRRK